ncbi:MAG: hypothetical protein ABI452_02210 [Candidatus Limnocylindrales bacterium]
MDLDRQELPRPRADEPPQRVPETHPPLLGDWFIYLSIVVLLCGVIAITALELGSPLESIIVRFPAMIGAALLAVVAADAALRTWRSVGAWLPINRPRAIQRVVWTAVLVGVLAACVALVIFMVSR